MISMGSSGKPDIVGRLLYIKSTLSKVVSIFKEKLKRLGYNQFIILFNHFSVLLSY